MTTPSQQNGSYRSGKPLLDQRPDSQHPCLAGWCQGEVIQRYQSHLSEPFKTHYKQHLFAVHRLPFLHCYPCPVSLRYRTTPADHKPLKLPRLLPLRKLHRPQPVPYPLICIPKYLLELLYPEISCPPFQIHIQFPNRLVHRQWVVPAGQLLYPPLELLQ